MAGTYASKMHGGVSEKPVRAANCLSYTFSPRILVRIQSQDKLFIALGELQLLNRPKSFVGLTDHRSPFRRQTACSAILEVSDNIQGLMEPKLIKQ